MTFDDLWVTLPLPAEFDAMDACDQARWRCVLEMAFEAGGTQAQAVAAERERRIKEGRW